MKHTLRRLGVIAPSQKPVLMIINRVTLLSSRTLVMLNPVPVFSYLSALLEYAAGTMRPRPSVGRGGDGAFEAIDLSAH